MTILATGWEDYARRIVQVMDEDGGLREPRRSGRLRATPALATAHALRVARTRAATASGKLLYALA